MTLRNPLNEIEREQAKYIFAKLQGRGQTARDIALSFAISQRYARRLIGGLNDHNLLTGSSPRHQPSEWTWCARTDPHAERGYQELFGAPLPISQAETDRRERMRHTVEVYVPEDAWKVNDGAKPLGSRLIVTLVVNGRDMHLEAWEVGYDAMLCQFLTDEDGSEDLDLLHAAVHGDGSFQTHKINGREYVLVATPYC